MATFAEVLDEVYNLTKRRDLVAETKTAVKAATLKAHQSDYYYKDLFETGIQFLTSELIQDLAYREVIPNFRSLKYIRRSDINADQNGPFFTLLTPEQILDPYGVNKENICYVAGEVIHIRSDAAFQYMFFGCYVNPNITEGAYNSWVSTDHLYAIVFEAARVIFKTIGYDEESSTYEKLVTEQFQLLKAANIDAHGY